MIQNCKRCGKVFNGVGTRGLCRECLQALEEIYSRSRVSEYIRRHINERDFDPDDAARELRVNSRDMRLLYDNGFMERDIQVYSKTPSLRQRLAEELGHAFDPKPAQRQLTPQPAPSFSRARTISYGGRKYERGFR